MGRWRDGQGSKPGGSGGGESGEQSHWPSRVCEDVSNYCMTFNILVINIT